MLLILPCMKDVLEPAKFGKQLPWGLFTATQTKQHLQQQQGFWWLRTLTRGPGGHQMVKTR